MNYISLVNVWLMLVNVSPTPVFFQEKKRNHTIDCYQFG